MPRSLTQYRVFIGSPGGLGEERNAFNEKLTTYTTSTAHHDDVVFHAVGWEDTLPGRGRAQDRINKDLDGCDYAIFMLHDRWGSSTGRYSSGVYEEFLRAKDLAANVETPMREFVVLFKRVEARQIRDPGEQLKQVLEFKAELEASKQHLLGSFDDIADFMKIVERHLGSWFADHRNRDKAIAQASLAVEPPPPTPSRADAPTYEYWIGQATTLADPANALFCAGQALHLAGSDVQWARARNAEGVNVFKLAKPAEALAAFTEITERLKSTTDPAASERLARAMLNIGVTLGALGRSEDAIAAFDDVLVRFGPATEAALQEQVAKALVNKGFGLDTLGRSEDAIAVYDDVVARFGTATETPLQEQVANALVNKGITLGTLGRSEDEIAVYDDVVARFGTATETALQEPVANALVNKGVTLGTLGRREAEIAVYDEIVALFGTATETKLQERVATALLYKGITLQHLNRTAEAAATYADLIQRLGNSPIPSIQTLVARATTLKEQRPK